MRDCHAKVKNKNENKKELRNKRAEPTLKMDGNRKTSCRPLIYIRTVKLFNQKKRFSGGKGESP